MPRTDGAKDFTSYERELLLSIVSDYLVFRVKPHEMIELLERRTKRRISLRTLTYLIKTVKERHGSAMEWLDDFAIAKMADFYRNRINEVEYVQKQLLLLFDEEANKTEHKNKYLMDKLAKTIGENSKILAEFGTAPPIMAKIQRLLPVDITDLNKRYDKHKSEVKNLINEIDPNNTVDLDNASLLQRQPTESTKNESLQSEFERIIDPRNAAQSGYRLDSNEQDDRRSDQGDNEPEEQPDDTEEQYIF